MGHPNQLIFILLLPSLSLPMNQPLIYTDKPWGFFEQFALNEQCTVKILHVKKGGCLSKQYHKNREELWVPLDNGLVMEIDGKTINPKKGEYITIAKGATHRLYSAKGGRVLEICVGFFDEQDIVRLEDKYGRISKM